MQSLTTSSISVISLIVSGNNGFWKATIHKKGMEKLGTSFKFSSSQIQDTVLLGTSVANSESPQKKFNLFSLKSQSASYYRVAILTHTLLLFLFTGLPVNNACLMSIT